MPRDASSRYQFVPRFTDQDGTIVGAGVAWLGTRVAIRYVPSADNTVHPVEAGDTLQNLASRYFRGFASPASLYWVIAEFQPEPIKDPTLRLEPGTLLVIPATRLVNRFLSSRPGSAEELDS